MAIRRLLFENYRSFRERQEIELAPITVVLGKNNSGKSALVRLPLILDTGFRTTSETPLDLELLGPDAVDDFRELFFEHNTVLPLTLGLTADSPHQFSLTAELTYADAQRTARIARLVLDSRENSLELISQRLLDVVSVDTPDVDGIALGPAREVGERFEVRRPGHEPRMSAVTFRGLLPPWSDFAGLGPGPIRYLGPHRERVARQHRLPIGTPGVLGTHGEGLPGLLAHDEARGGGQLMELINRRLNGIVPGWRLAEIPAGPLWSTVLARSGGVRVNLADAGSGLAQVLPTLAQCALDDLQGSSAEPSLQIIEEPEMHLHPAAHAELADLYLATAQTTGTRFLIETHSETLLLRLRRRIAQADTDYGPDMVAIYVVEQTDGVSQVRRVGLDELGNLDQSWPQGYFSQDYHEARAIAAAQIDRTGRAS
jgi:hypothetical protein